MIKKSICCIALAATVSMLCAFLEAQETKKVARIGLLSGAADPAKPVLWEPFFEGQNIILERRFANGKTERVPEFAADLTRLKVDLIVVTGTTETRAAKQA